MEWRAQLNIKFPPKTRLEAPQNSWIKKNVIEMINTFDELISRLDKAEERIRDLENDVWQNQ